MRRKHHCWLLLTLLAACTAPAPPPAPTAQPRTTITFAAPADERVAYQPLLARFLAENPDLAVQFVELPATATTRQAVTAADTAVLPIGTLSPQDVTDRLVLDLAPLLAADAAFAPADSYPAGQPPRSADGGSYLLPLTLALPLVGYNPAVWAARGLPAPKPDWRWTDLLAAAEQLAERQGATVVRAGWLDDSRGLEPLRGLLADAQVPLDLAGLTTNQPAVLTALAAMPPLFAHGVIASRFRTLTSGVSLDEVRQLIHDQGVALWPITWQPAAATLPFPVRLAALPATAPWVSRSAVISRGTAHPAAAWRWLAFLSRSVLPASASSSTLPARRSLAEASPTWLALDPASQTVLRSVLARPPNAPADPLANATLRQALDAVLAGTPPTTALRQALARTSVAALPTATPLAATAVPVVVATPRPTAAPGVTTIVFNAAGLERATITQITQLATQFQHDQPQIAVEVVAGLAEQEANPAAELDYSLATVARGADCFAWITQPSHELVPLLYDLQPLMDADATFVRDDIPPLLLARFQAGTATYGLPYAYAPVALAYNPAVFDAAGVAYPTAAWTFADLLDAATKLTGGSGAQRRFGIQLDQAGELSLFLSQFGARTLRGDAASFQPTYTDPAVQQAVRTYVDLVRSSAPEARLAGYRQGPPPIDDEAVNPITAGRVGMWLTVGLPPANFAPPDVRLVPLPADGRVLTDGGFGSKGLYISASSAFPQACWQWISYLSRSGVGVGAWLPASRAAAESAAYRATADPRLLALDAPTRALFTRPVTAADQIPRWGRVYPDDFWFYRAVDRALQGAELEPELARAQNLTEQYLACARSGGALYACAKQTDPQYQGWALP